MTNTSLVTFHKMHGCGNDFVLVDNRELALPVEHMVSWAKALCPRGFGIGADGFIFLEAPVPQEPRAAFRWHFFNADGSRAEMCGNASRCAARLAVELGLAPTRHAFLTDAGLIEAEVLGPDLVKVRLTDPVDLRLNLDLDVAGQARTVQFVNTGVPHAVVFVPDVQAEDIMRFGPALRHHEHFAPKGTNANLAQVVDPGTLLLRTYERGVEGETHACGTGAVATVYLAHKLGLTGPHGDVTTSGGEVLSIDIAPDGVRLTGKAVKVYTGQFDPVALGLSGV